MIKYKYIDRMGVLVLLSHLIITLVVLCIYGWSLYSGTGDETLKTILTVIIGYWFGAVGKEAIMSRPQRKHNDKGNIEKGA